MPREHINRQIRSVNAGHGKVRYDITLPMAILEKAGVPTGGTVEVRVAPGRRYIILMPLRGDDWPRMCDKPDCGRVLGHDGECIPESEVPF